MGGVRCHDPRRNTNSSVSTVIRVFVCLILEQLYYYRLRFLFTVVSAFLDLLEVQTAGFSFFFIVNSREVLQ